MTNFEIREAFRKQTIEIESLKIQFKTLELIVARNQALAVKPTLWERLFGAK